MKRNDWLAPALLMAFSAVLIGVLYGYHAAALPLWTDELYSLQTADHGFKEMIRLLQNYQPWYYDHPPLYFLILRNAFLISDSPLSLRMPTLIFAAATIGGWAIMMRKQGFTTFQAAALVSLIAFHPSFAFHATSVRMYTMVLLEASAAIFILWYLPKAPMRERIGLTLALTLDLGMFVYTSYFGIMFAIGVGALGFVWIIWPQSADVADRKVGFCVLAACVGSAILLLPWMPVVFRIPIREREFPLYLSPTRPEQVWEIVKSFCRTIPGCLFIVLGWIWLFLFGERRIQWSLYAVTLIGVPLAILAIGAPRDRIIDARYMFFSLPLLLSAAGNGWIAAGRRFVTSMSWRAILIGAIFLAPLFPYHLSARQRYLQHHPDWWQAARIFKENAKPDEIILTGGYLSGEAMFYHLERLGADPNRDFSWIHYVIEMNPFYDYCRNPKIVWFVGVGNPPEQFRAILFRYFPYRKTFPGNRAIDPEADLIQVYAKKPFQLPDGSIAPYFEPVPLSYEQPPPVSAPKAN